MLKSELCVFFFFFFFFFSKGVFKRYKFKRMKKGHEELFMQERVIFSFRIYKSVG